MPTVLRIGPYRFHFYSRENDEPPHIHVARDDFEAKFWLQPVSLAANLGFNQAEPVAQTARGVFAGWRSLFAGNFVARAACP